MRYPKTITFLIALGLLSSACGTESATTVPTLPPLTITTMAADMDMTTDSSMAMTTDSSMDMNMDEHADEEHIFAFGEPGDASIADRIIDVTTLDTFQFTPDPITVKVGETITFRITNDGNLPHDVVLDDQDGQDAHEVEMAEMAAEGNMIMADEANGFALLAGESKTLTWTFTEAGTVFLGCHQPGHYAAGMIASVIVEP